MKFNICHYVTVCSIVYSDSQKVFYFLAQLNILSLCMCSPHYFRCSTSVQCYTPQKEAKKLTELNAELSVREESYRVRADM